MGLYNYVTCEMELPDGWDYSDSFQSKSPVVDVEMNELTITRKGRLMVRYWEYETGSPEGDLKELDYTGPMVFYASETTDTPDDWREYWHEYCAWFEDGWCVKLESVDAFHDELNTGLYDERN